MTAEAFRMKFELARLLKRHNCAMPVAKSLPLRPSVAGDLFIEATIPAVMDYERVKFRVHCWMPLDHTRIPLLIRHDAEKVAGELLAIRSTDEGLELRARLVDAEAKQLGGLSVAATIYSYVIKDADDPAHFRAEILCCRLDECSVTDRPANPAALWKPASGPAHFYDLAIRHVSLLGKRVELLRKQLREAPPPPPAPRLIAVDRKKSEPSVVRPPRASSSDFSRLVGRLNELHPLA